MFLGGGVLLQTPPWHLDYIQKALSPMQGPSDVLWSCVISAGPPTELPASTNMMLALTLSDSD